jgi:hypothetical protein
VNSPGSIRTNGNTSLVPKISPYENGGFAEKWKRFSVEQIVAVLKQIELGISVAKPASSPN